MPIYQTSHDQGLWTAADAGALINAILGEANPTLAQVIALMEQWPPRPAGAHIRVDLPDNWLEDAIRHGAIRVLKPVDAGPVLDEWKECRSTIGRFDGLVVDLRKTGFGFVTAIASGATFFFSYDPAKPEVPESGKFAVFTIIMVLTLTLYVIDRVHQVLLQEAVDYAAHLEAQLRFNISRLLGANYTRRHGILLGVAIYLVLLSAVYLASLLSSDAWRVGSLQVWWQSGYQPLMLAELILGVAIIEFVVLRTRFW
jgi:hypothetical protein